MAWLNRLDAKWKTFDASWEAWLDRRLSPVFDLVMAWLPALMLIAVVVLGWLLAD